VRVTTWDHSRKLHYRIQRGGTSKGLATSESVTKRARRTGGMGNFVQRTLWKDKLTSGSKGDASVGLVRSYVVAWLVRPYLVTGLVRSYVVAWLVRSYLVTGLVRFYLVTGFCEVVFSYWLSEVLLCGLTYWGLTYLTEKYRDFSFRFLCFLWVGEWWSLRTSSNIKIPHASSLLFGIRSLYKRQFLCYVG
jgi:hypothetical protein